VGRAGTRRVKSRRRGTGVSDVLGGRLFGGPRRTAREFVSVVGLVFALVAILVLQTWQRIEVTETMEANQRLAEELLRLGDLVVCREMDLGRQTARPLLLARARDELGLRPAVWGEVVFVPDTGGVRTARPDAAGFSTTAVGGAL